LDENSPDVFRADRYPHTRAGQAIRFLAAGGAAALLNFSSRLLFSEFMSFGSAVFCAFWVGLATAFVLSRRWVFGPSGRGVAREAGWFLAVNLAALLQTWVLSLWLAGLFSPHIGVKHAEAVAHFAGIMIPVLSSWFGHRYLTFRRPGDTGNDTA
jgi:putative flippase GtrA